MGNLTVRNEEQKERQSKNEEGGGTQKSKAEGMRANSFRTPELSKTRSQVESMNFSSQLQAQTEKSGKKKESDYSETTCVYEQYTISITQVKMEYAENYEKWLATGKVEPVIDEMAYKFQLELRKSKGSVLDPEMLLSGKLSHVKMHFTPLVY